MTYDDNLFSDLHKDAYGIRPRGKHMYYEATPAVKQEIWDSLLVALEHTLQAEKDSETEAELEFEINIQRNLEHGAPDRATAIRWIVDALDIVDSNQGAGYICYLLHLNYNHATEIGKSL
jgi:hypothetical protein